MPSHTLLGGLATTIVGGSIAAGVGYAMMPEKKSNEQQSTPSNEPIFVPPNFSHTTNYLVLVVGALPRSVDAPKETCTLNTDCQLFSKYTKAIIANEQTDLIQTNGTYIFNTSFDSLNLEDVVSLNIGTDKNLLLLVQSKPAKDKSISIAPKQPDNLIDKQKLLETYKKVKSIHINDLELLSKHFYNMLEESYVYRKDIKHDSFLIFEWKSSTIDQINNAHLSRIDARIDQYIFKSFEDQKLEQADNPELMTIINQIPKKTLIEIYEIQNEEAIKDVMDSLKTKKTTIGKPNWEILAQENLMLTKTSQLKNGKYYKFVFSDFEEIEKIIDRGLNSFKIDLKYSDSYSHTLLRKSELNQNYFCIKFSDKSNLLNKCDVFKYPPQLDR